MDLLGAIRGALDLFSATIDSSEPWARDESSFAQHFGESYGTFQHLLSLLTEDQHRRFERTLEVNPEAAVLWVLSMEEI